MGDIFYFQLPQTLQLYKEYKQKFLFLISKSGAAISKEKHGEVLAAITYKAVNSNLMNLASGYAEQTFGVYKSFNKELAADFYFKIGTLVLERNPNIAVEFISKSTQLAADEIELEQTVLICSDKAIAE